jgi:succinoglycan biosynthesis transport protein ExoP
MRQLTGPGRNLEPHDDGAGETAQSSTYPIRPPDTGVPSLHVEVASNGSAGLTHVRTRLPGAGLPPDSDSDLSKYLRALQSRWKIIVATFAVVVLGTAVGTALATPRYRATGTIEIRKQAAEVVPVDALFQVERISDQYLQTQYGLLRSPALSQRAVQDPSFVRELRNRGFLSDTAAGGEAAQLTALAKHVAEELTVNPIAGSRLVKVAYEATDPWLAAAVVNSVFTHFIAARDAAATAALTALAQQADSVRADIRAAEHTLQTFVTTNGLGEAGLGGPATLENVPQERLRLLQQELTLAETDGFRAAAAYGSTAADRRTLDSELLKSLRLRLAEAQGEYARLRSTFTDSYPRAKQVKNELRELDLLLAQEQRRIAATMGSQYKTARRRRDLLQAAVNDQRARLDSLAAKAAEYDRLRREVDGHNQMYAALQQKRREAALSAALATMDVSVLDAPVAPDDPVSPNPRRDLPLAACVGLLLGLGLAFLRESLDTSVRTPEELNTLGGVPVIAMIPSVAPLRPRNRTFAALPRGVSNLLRGDRQAKSYSALTEAFSGLRTSVLFNAREAQSRSLLITSAQPAEGKTTISTNLSISLTVLGRRVLLIDADIRAATLHQIFGIDRVHGLTDIMSGVTDWRSTVRANVLPLLDVIPAGSSADHPSDLLSANDLSAMVREAEAEYDFVILDAPALFINAADTRLLAPAVDGVVVVIRSGSTPRGLLQRMVAQVPNVIGVVLNDLNLRRFPSYYRPYANADAASVAGELVSPVRNAERAPLTAAR